MGDDELGDPDIGFDYDKLMSAMEGDDDDADSDDGADGEPSDDEDEGASDENEDAAAGSSDDAEDDGSSGSSEDEDGDDSDADDWVMMEGAEAAAAAAEDGNSKKAKKKRKLQDAGESYIWYLMLDAALMYVAQQFGLSLLSAAASGQVFFQHGCDCIHIRNPSSALVAQTCTLQYDNSNTCKGVTPKRRRGLPLADLWYRC